VGESYHFLSEKVRKVPLTVDCVETSYDITKPQPQLFVTDDFKKLENVIDELAERMAYRRGGLQGLETARKARTLTTTEFESGVQVTGILTEYRQDSGGALSFLKWTGPSQLSQREVQLPQQGPDYHREGFSSPVGLIKGLPKAPSLATAADWQSIGCVEGSHCRIEFVSGIIVEGRWVSTQKSEGKTLVMVFEQVRVSQGQEILFDPSWGTFDMILAEKVVSVFGGAADRHAYFEKQAQRHFKPRAQKSNGTDLNRDLAKLYSQVREIRHRGPLQGDSVQALLSIYGELNKSYLKDWLLRLEILELLQTNPQSLRVCEQIKGQLEQLGDESDRLKMLVRRGLALLGL
jgi:phenylalanine-4-hydroxylase